MKNIKEKQKILLPSLVEQYQLDVTGLVQAEEKIYHGHVMEVCDDVIDQQKHILLLTGPSGSGKTTTSIKIVTELRQRGKKVNFISLDNFYKPNQALPLWSDGNKNYESIEAMDVDYFNEKIRELTAYGAADFPRYDFVSSSRRKDAFTIHYDEDTFLIFEGIQALNPLLCEHLVQDNIMRIYVSTHSDFVDGAGQVVIKAKDLRLMRRLLRDYTHRGIDVKETLDLWIYVLRGEKIYIQPFRKFADIYINSAHCYEPLVYRDDLLKLLVDHRSEDAGDKQANRLFEILEWLPSLSEENIPQTSLIREFI